MTYAGLNTLAIHLFLVYWGIASNITPPVALASMTAAGVAQAPFVKTWFQSMRLGILIYLLPFFFIFAPEPVLQGSLAELPLTFFSLLLGVALLARALEKHMIGWGRLSTLYQRLLAAVSGFLLAIPSWQTDAAGICLFLVLIFVSYWSKKEASVGM